MPSHFLYIISIFYLQGSFRYYYDSIKQESISEQANALYVMRRIIGMLREQTDALIDHVTAHLVKEETQCLPMVQKHLSKAEISSLVGNIMGKRSAEVMTKILKLAMLSLKPLERMDMMLHMKEAMAGTFFEQWLILGGWSDSSLVDKTVSELQGKTPSRVEAVSGLPSPTLGPAAAAAASSSSSSSSPVRPNGGSLKRPVSHLTLDANHGRGKRKNSESWTSDLEYVCDFYFPNLCCRYFVLYL